MITFRREGSLIRHGLNITFSGGPSWSIGFAWRSNYDCKHIRFAFYPRKIQYQDTVIHKAFSFKVYKGTTPIRTL